MPTIAGLLKSKRRFKELIQCIDSCIPWQDFNEVDIKVEYDNKLNPIVISAIYNMGVCDIIRAGQVDYDKIIENTKIEYKNMNKAELVIPKSMERNYLLHVKRLINGFKDSFNLDDVIINPHFKGCYIEGYSDMVCGKSLVKFNISSKCEPMKDIMRELLICHVLNSVGCGNRYNFSECKIYNPRFNVIHDVNIDFSEISVEELYIKIVNTLECEKI